MTKKPNPDKFAFDSVAPEEAGTVKDDNGKELSPGEDGFLEALAKEAGFTIEDEDATD
jgi:hypothetical protein|tara:strand:- start:980 stop:1153 length:174 start_codon:yes stop_codon:yes gene_type:complete